MRNHRGTVSVSRHWSRNRDFLWCRKNRAEHYCPSVWLGRVVLRSIGVTHRPSPFSSRTAAALLRPLLTTRFAPPRAARRARESASPFLLLERRPATRFWSSVPSCPALTLPGLDPGGREDAPASQGAGPRWGENVCPLWQYGTREPSWWTALGPRREDRGRR